MTTAGAQLPGKYDRSRVIERANGCYWLDEEGQEHGPFATVLEALEEMQGADESSLEPGESLEEAESEIGIAAWTDPDTGEPAEEERPRIADDH